MPVMARLLRGWRRREIEIGIVAARPDLGRDPMREEYQEIGRELEPALDNELVEIGGMAEPQQQLLLNGIQLGAAEQPLGATGPRQQQSRLFEGLADGADAQSHL